MGVTRRAALALPFPALLLPAPLAGAQGWSPARPLRLIVPFPPGGTTDTLARMTAERMAALLGHDQPLGLQLLERSRDRFTSGPDLGGQLLLRSVELELHASGARRAVLVGMIGQQHGQAGGDIAE